MGEGWDEGAVRFTPPPPIKGKIIKIDPVGDDEIVWLKNVGDGPVDLSGWRLTTPPSFEFDFPEGYFLDPGAELKIHSGPGARIHQPFLKDTPVCHPGGDLLWTAQYVWCDLNGDTAYLYDAQGNQVDKYEYGAGWHVSFFVPCDRAGSAGCQTGTCPSH